MLLGTQRSRRIEAQDSQSGYQARHHGYQEQNHRSSSEGYRVRRPYAPEEMLQKRTVRNDNPQPAITPANARRMPGRIAWVTAWPAVEPNASRIPSSRVRCVIDCEISP